MKTRSKVVATVLSVMMLVGTLPFAGCTPTQPQGTIVEPPAPIYSVQSVTLQYNNVSIAGTLTADISAKQLQLNAVVQKDEQANGVVTYTSSDEGVATIANDGTVTLLSEGETVISAKAGDKSHTIVLIVNDDFSAKESYTITVNGGTASLTEAAVGEYVTLSAIIPEHKDFIRWNYDVRGLWTNGNVFKMPAQDIVITADYTDKLYTLNVIGAEVTVDGEQLDGEIIGNSKNGTEAEYDIVSYGVAYGTEVKVEAIEEPEGKMFVGWDGGVINNRVGEMGDPEYTFEMPDETYTIWANFSNLTSKVLTASKPGDYWNTSAGSKLITNGVPEGEAEDPELGGLSGYRLTFTPGDSATSGYTNENITGSVLDTIVEGTNTMKAVFKNHGDHDVTLELFASFYGNICTSGEVTIPANSTVTKFFTGGLGINNPWMGVALRKEIEGSGASFNVDMVLGSAPMYPEGDPLLSVTGKAELVQLDSSTDTKYNWTREFFYNEKYGLATYSIYGKQFSGNVPAARTCQITNMPAYDAENPYTIVYARVINNATSGDYLSQFDICVGTDADPRGGANTYYETVVHEKVGDVVLIAIKIPRTENDGQFYFSVRKTTVEGTGTYYPHNFSVVLAYNNVFGYEGEVE